jgi:hypothetical protein
MTLHYGRGRAGGAAYRPPTAELFLPLGEDGGPLPVVAPGAFPPASDAALTDRTVLAQIRRR